jgi:hypothetical protein
MSKFYSLIRNGSEIQWWKSVAIPYLIRRIKQTPLNFYGKLYWGLKDVDFISVSEEDWDNLIILDACRYDIFAEEYSGVGKLQRRYSRSPYSPSFFQKNFTDGPYFDIVSITANPHHKQRLEDSQFHSVSHLWNTHWNEEIKNVHPRAVKDVAIEANETYPNKRLMIHFMQPHAPFIGPWAQENIGIHTGNEHSRQDAIQGYYDKDQTNPYILAAKGTIEDSELEQGYRENLNIVLKYTKDLISKLDGKTVVTADHGELLGERAWPYPWKMYQHPPILAGKLLEVPWLVIDSEDRREIISEEPTEVMDDINLDTQKRLKYLGYK